MGYFGGTAEAPTRYSNEGKVKTPTMAMSLNAEDTDSSMSDGEQDAMYFDMHHSRDMQEIIMMPTMLDDRDEWVIQQLDSIGVDTSGTNKDCETRLMLILVHGRQEFRHTTESSVWNLLLKEIRQQLSAAGMNFLGPSLSVIKRYSSFVGGVQVTYKTRSPMPIREEVITQGTVTSDGGSMNIKNATEATLQHMLQMDIRWPYDGDRLHELQQLAGRMTLLLGENARSNAMDAIVTEISEVYPLMPDLAMRHAILKYDALFKYATAGMRTSEQNACDTYRTAMARLQNDPTWSVPTMQAMRQVYYQSGMELLKVNLALRVKTNDPLLLDCETTVRNVFADAVYALRNALLSADIMNIIDELAAVMYQSIQLSRLENLNAYASIPIGNAEDMMSSDDTNTMTHQSVGVQTDPKIVLEMYAQTQIHNMVHTALQSDDTTVLMFAQYTQTMRTGDASNNHRLDGLGHTGGVMKSYCGSLVIMLIVALTVLGVVVMMPDIGYYFALDIRITIMQAPGNNTEMVLKIW